MIIKFIKHHKALIVLSVIFITYTTLILIDIDRRIYRDFSKVTENGWEYIKMYDDAKKSSFIVITGYCGNEHDELTVPEHIDNAVVKIIDGRIFEPGYKLNKLFISDYVEEIGLYAFDSTEINEIIFGDNSRLRKLNGRSCMGSVTLKKIVLPESLEYIGDESFAYAFHLEEIYIGSNVNEIQDGVFAQTNICRINVSEENERYENKDGFLIDKTENKLIVFDHNLFNEKLIIPAYIKDIDTENIDGNYLKSIEVDENNEYYSSYNGCLYSKDKKVFCRAPEGMEIEDFKFAEGVETIGRYAFWYCFSFDRLDIPDTVTDIEMWSFDRQDVYLPKTLKSADLQLFVGTVHFRGTEQDWKKIWINNAIPEDELQYDLIFMEK